MEGVVAKGPASSTDALGANRTPFGLERKTWPLAVRRPKISDGLFPRTRLSAIAEELGWAKFTQAPQPIEKVSHCRIAFWEYWSIGSLLPLAGIAPLPAVTLPPVGSVFAVVCARTGL